MRNVYEVLQEKESAVQRVAHEIEMLRLVAPLLADDASTGLPTHDVQSQGAQTRGAPTGDALSHDAPTDKMPAGYAPAHDISEEDANTGIVSTPSLLTNGFNDAVSDNHDEADSVPEARISGRLKRLVRPFVSFVAG
jgi:hypothetical protein